MCFLQCTIQKTKNVFNKKYSFISQHCHENLCFYVCVHCYFIMSLLWMLHVCIVIKNCMITTSINDKADNECAGFNFLEPACFYFTYKASSAYYIVTIDVYSYTKVNLWGSYITIVSPLKASIWRISTKMSVTMFLIALPMWQDCSL